MKRILGLYLTLIVTGLISFAQTPLSNDFNNPTLIEIQQDCNYNSFTFDQHSGTDLFLPTCYRMYPGASSWFKFTVPQNGMATVKVKLPNQTRFGLAFYHFEAGAYQEIKCNTYYDTEGSLVINANEQFENTEILVRFWQLGTPSSGTIDICILNEGTTFFMPKLLSVDQAGYTPQELVEDVLITGCLTASNITFTGESEQIGYFSDGIPGLDFEIGIIMSTGNVADAPGPNISGSTGDNLGGPGDSDLEAIMSGEAHDAAILEFDFVPASDEVAFEYVFGSEEYMEFANSSFNDGFALFISGGPEGYSNENIALIPGTTTPVSINNINETNNSTYYINNETGADIEYDGLTVTLTARADVTACETYHIKMAITDVSDGIYDSAIFLKANSFTSGESYTVESFNTWSSTSQITRGCTNYIVFYRTEDSPIDEAVPVELDISGTATPDVDYSAIPENLEIPAGEDSLVFYFDAYIVGAPQGDETIILTFENGCPCSTSETQHIITLVDPIDVDAQLDNDGPICVGENATITLTLNSSDPSIIGIEWSTGDVDVNQIVVSPTTTTTYSVNLIYPCDTITVTNTLTVVEPPTVDLGPDIDVEGLITNIDAGIDAGNTGEWTFNSGPGNATVNPQNASNATITVDAFGVYNFTWTETSLAPNCVSSDDININFYHTPTADFYVAPILCFGDLTTVTFTGDIVPGQAVLNWDFGGANVISGTGEGPYVLEYTQGGVHTISLTITEGTATAENEVEILVPYPLDGTLTIVDDPCFQSCGGSATINVTGGTLPYDYSWSSTTNVLNNLCAGDYGLIVTDANDCTFNTNFTIDEPPLLDYDTTYNHIACFGELTGNASITPNGGTPPYSFIWSDGYNLPIHSNITAGQYVVTATDQNGCSVMELFQINQPDLLQVVTNGDFELCENQTINVAGQPIGGTAPYTIYWDNGTGFVVGNQTFELEGHQDVTYSVYVEDANGCISNTATTEIIVSPTMHLSLETQDNTCHGDCDGSALINVTGGIQPFDYSWDSDGPLLNNLCAGLYTITITDHLGCTADTMFNITEPNALQLTVQSVDAPCSYSEGGTATAIVSGGTPPYNYLWETGNTTNELIATEGTYNLTVSDDHNCRLYGSALIEAPEELFVLPLYNPTICIGGEAEVIAQATGGTAHYDFHWQGSDGSEYWGHQIFVNPTTTTTYSLTVTDRNGCTTDGYSSTVTVNPPITIEHIINSVNNVCLGYSTQIELVISGGNGGPYTVTIPGEDGTPEIISSPFDFYPQENTNLIFTVNDLCETPSVQDSIMIYVHEKPFVDFNVGINEGCPGQSVAFNSLDTVSNYEYVWNFGDEVFAFVKNPVHSYEESGMFDVTLTVRDEFGCTDSLTKYGLVTIFPKPYSNFSAEPKTASILNPQIKFLNHSEEALFYFWYYGDGDSTINFRDPVHFFNDMGEYEVMLVSENGYGCTDTAKRSIIIHDEYTIWTPTAFTPNGDGVNDCFKICGNGIDANNFKIIIYDRWGEMVYSTEKFDKDSECSTCSEGAWDGTKRSRKAGDSYYPNGIYYWYATFTDIDGIGHEYRGNVQLLR